MGLNYLEVTKLEDQPKSKRLNTKPRDSEQTSEQKPQQTKSQGTEKPLSPPQIKNHKTKRQRVEDGSSQSAIDSGTPTSPQTLQDGPKQCDKRRRAEEAQAAPTVEFTGLKSLTVACPFCPGQVWSKGNAVGRFKAHLAQNHGRMKDGKQITNEMLQPLGLAQCLYCEHVTTSSKILTHRCIPGSFGASAHRDHISDNEFKVPKYLQRKIPSRKTIPSEAKQEWILACQQFLHRLTVVQPTDVEFRVRTYQLLCLPTAMLSLDDEDKAHNSRQRQRSLKERLAEVFLTDGEDLVFAKPEDDGSQISSDEDMDELYEDDAEEKRQDKHRKQRKTQRQAEKKIDKCVILAQMGAWHKALQTLQPSKLADSSAPEVQQL